MQATLLLSVVLLLPSYCLAGLGLGGLEPAAPAAPQAAVALDVDVPTDLCQKEFCLAASPRACGGNCILTPLNNVTEYCSLKCVETWDTAEVKGCLADKAAGSYIGTKLTAISNVCNAGKIAAARRKAILAKYNNLFPCTQDVNATAVIGLDSCLTGSNATDTTCPQACSSGLLGIPAACRETFPEESKPWESTLESCIQGDAAAPASTGIGATEGVSGGLGAAFAPSSGEDTSDSSASAQAAGSPLKSLLLAAGGAIMIMFCL